MSTKRPSGAGIVVNSGSREFLGQPASAALEELADLQSDIGPPDCILSTSRVWLASRYDADRDALT